jgi:hypothetical protein
MGKKIRIRIRIEQPGSYFRELKRQFFGLEYLNSFMRIRDGKNSDEHPGSATLHTLQVMTNYNKGPDVCY